MHLFARKVPAMKVGFLEYEVVHNCSTSQQFLEPYNASGTSTSKYQIHCKGKSK